MSRLERRAARQRIYYRRHKKRCQRATRRWVKNNPEKVRLQRNAWAARNRNRIKVYKKRPYACYTTERRQATYLRNKQNEKRIQRNCTLKRLYGIDIKAYEKMLNAQGGVCAICSSPPRNKSLAVDHNHQTGEVRKLLCQPCNARLGVLEDKSWLEKARIYLESHG